MNAYKPDSTRASLIAFTLTVLLFGAIGAFIWSEVQVENRLASDSPSLPSSTAGVQPPAHAARKPVEPGHRGVYKCAGRQGVTYQDAPCAGVELSVSGGTFSTIDPEPVRPAQAPVVLAAKGAAISRKSAGPEPSECIYLRKALRRIDAQARHRSSDLLTRERRATVNRMTELGCSEFD